MTKSEVTITEVTKSEVNKSEVTKSEVTKSEVTKSEVNKSEVTKSEVTKSEVTKSEKTKSEVTKAVVNKSSPFKGWHKTVALAGEDTVSLLVCYACKRSECCHSKYKIATLMFWNCSPHKNPDMGNKRQRERESGRTGI